MTLYNNLIVWIYFVAVITETIKSLVAENFEKCQTCRGLVNNVLTSGASNGNLDVGTLITILCTQFADPFANATLCQTATNSGNTTDFNGFTYLFGKIIATIALVKKADLCGLFIDGCGPNPFTSKWQVEIPPKRKQSSKIKHSRCEHHGRRKPLRFLQLSDLHIDFDYTVGAEADCCASSTGCTTFTTCCVPSQVNTTPKLPAPFWGTSLVGSCDLPYRTIESLFRHLNCTEEEFDFALLAGDYASHNSVKATKTEHIELIANLSALIDRFLPGTPFFWTIGNHEEVPVNQFASHSVMNLLASPEIGPQWIYKTIYDAGSKFLPPTVEESAIYRGSYSTRLPSTNVKLISLNTNYCLTSNFWLYLNDTDPDGTLNWLVAELLDAEERDRHVYILGHVPPGSQDIWFNECFSIWSKNYYDIVNRFNEIIFGQFFGHYHPDTFKLFYERMGDSSSKPTNVLFLGPSVSTKWLGIGAGFNPAYRIYTANRQTGEVLDFETFYTDLAKPMSDEQQPEWHRLYRARKEYQLEDLSPLSWHILGDRLLSEPKLAKKFIKNFYRRTDEAPEELCDAKCLQKTVCQSRDAYGNSFSSCVDED